MTGEQVFTTRLAYWDDDRDMIAPVRTQVFVVEQGVPPEIEMDDMDARCVHAIAQDAQRRVIGTGRLLPAQAGTARIGRMAVYEEWRGRRVGAALLHLLMDAARRRGDREIELHAQSRAERFYLREGFTRQGEEYLEAGIAHVNMRKYL